MAPQPAPIDRPETRLIAQLLGATQWLAGAASQSGISVPAHVTDATDAAVDWLAKR